MPLRLVDVYLADPAPDLAPLDENHDILGYWSTDLHKRGRLVRILLDTEETEALLDWLDQHIGSSDHHRIVMLPVEATLPRPNDRDKEAEADEAEDDKPNRTSGRISREELYQDVNEAIGGGVVYYALVLLSTVVAAGGMLRDSVAIVIGAMVIAPLIGPNIAVALGTTLGDTDLLRRALKVNVMGLLLGFGLAVTVGYALPVDPTVGEIASRTWVRIDDLVLALAAGIAGALSMTRGLSTALIGVMVAVALLPPLAAAGMLLGAGYFYFAYGAFLLLLTNIASINLAGVITFLVQGLRPVDWYEAKRAKVATRRAVILWLGLVALLITAFVLAEGPAL